MNRYLDFLETKPLFYKEIDYGRMPRIWKRVQDRFNLPKIIHIVGTNGKGTTGRFIANALFKAGLKVGHYSSPHVLKFNERIWKNSKDIDDQSLQEAHEYLSKILKSDEIDSLSYFEYTTLMAAYLFQDCDYAVFEAGMGGEYDATNIFDKILSVVTLIDYDHQDFLGNSIEEIAKTKLNSIKNIAIIGRQKHKEVKKVIHYLEQTKGIKAIDCDDIVDEKDSLLIDKTVLKNKWPDFIRDNLKLAVAVLRFLNIKLNDSFFEVKLPLGRFYRLNDNITVDVGHNISAAKALKESLKDKKVVLIYNTFKDKDYKDIIKILKPSIKRVEILPVESDRIENEKVLRDFLSKMGIENRIFKGIDSKEEYLVFGSFTVVEKFLKDIFER
ncbi:MAG: bifunctional folylpolyglutamate synthase/dihydrofolate synthase [Epsilonproteobacteria bacterium]|nr:bifunctional folylpolyglutamate synthase/dihydrofolate synthase [Campylobacterota bacterium]